MNFLQFVVFVFLGSSGILCLLALLCGQFALFRQCIENVLLFSFFFLFSFFVFRFVFPLFAFSFFRFSFFVFIFPLFPFSITVNLFHV